MIQTNIAEAMYAAQNLQGTQQQLGHLSIWEPEVTDPIAIKHFAHIPLYFCHIFLWLFY